MYVSNICIDVSNICMLVIYVRFIERESGETS